jgi:hypothetical protein
MLAVAFVASELDTKITMVITTLCSPILFPFGKDESMNNFLFSLR